MNNSPKSLGLHILSSARLLALCSALILILITLPPAHAQNPDPTELINQAEKALQELLTPCSSSKFLECITIEKDGPSLDGFMNRAVNGGTEATDIKIIANLDQASALAAFQSSAGSYAAAGAADKFWTSETFQAGPGKAGTGRIAVWYPTNADKPQANGRGEVICGNLNISFRTFITAPAGVFQTDEQALVNVTKTQLRTLMEQVTQALISPGACASAAPLLKLYTDPTANLDSVYVGDSVRLNGVVWSKEESGLQRGPVAAKIEISSGPRGAVVETETDKTGYYELDYPILDVTAGSILVNILTPDKNKYTDGIGRVNVSVQERGALTVSASTDKASIKRGDSITVKGTVSVQGSLVPAHISLYSDALPVTGKDANSDGTFEFSFVPGTEPKRNDIGGFGPGIHLVLIKATLLGYGEGNTSANYLLQDDVVTADNCAPVSATILAVQGVANVTPLDDDAKARQGILSGFAKVNKNTILAQGMTIKAADGARVAVRFDFAAGSDATIVVNGGGTLNIGRLCKDANGKIHVAVSVEKLTQVAVNVRNNNPENGPLDFDLITPSVSVRSVQTRYFINVNDAGATTIAALDGNVIVDDVLHTNGIELVQGSVIQVGMGENPAEVSMSDVQGQLDPTVVSMLDGAFVPPVVPTPQALPTVAALPTDLALPTGAALPTEIALPATAVFLPTAPPLGNPPGTGSGDTSPNVNLQALILERQLRMWLPVGVGVLVLAAIVGGILVLRRRGKPAPPPRPVYTTPPPIVILPSDTRPPGLPEQKSAPAASSSPVSFQHAEDEYFKLRGQLSTGRLTQADFEARLQSLMVQDAQGRYWLLGADTGKWYVHDGQNWVEGTPPVK